MLAVRSECGRVGGATGWVQYMYLVRCLVLRNCARRQGGENLSKWRSAIGEARDHRCTWQCSYGNFARGGIIRMMWRWRALSRSECLGEDGWSGRQIGQRFIVTVPFLGRRKKAARSKLAYCTVCSSTAAPARVCCLTSFLRQRRPGAGHCSQ